MLAPALQVLTLTLGRGVGSHIPITVWLHVATSLDGHVINFACIIEQKTEIGTILLVVHQ